MKILVLANFDIGLYKFRKELLQRLLQEGHEVTISLPYGDYVPEMEAMGCRFIRTDVDRRGMNPVRDIRLLQEYRKILRNVRPDLVVSYTIKPNIYGGLACRMRHIPYAPNVTGLGSAIQNGGALQKFILGLYRVAFRKAKVIFFENTANRDFLVNAGVIPEGRDTVLNGAGINLDDHPSCAYPQRNAVRFLFVGRIMKEKGVDELFAAAQKLKAEYGSNAEIQLVGLFEESYKGTVEQLEKDGTVDFAGYQSDVKPFYNACSCAVLPSYHEGMSNVLLEAAASGRPLITSNIPGCREAVMDGESGFLCEPKNADDLAEKMRQFMELSCEQREAMGKAGRQHMEAHFDKREVVRMTIEHLIGAIT